MKGKPNPEKARKHEDKGDAHFEKGRFDKALKEYRKAVEIFPDLPGIYDKLNRAHDRKASDWKMADFADSVGWTMERQARDSAPIRQVHARLSPEWKEASLLAYGILADREEKSLSEKTEKLVAMGEIATRALIGVLMDLKHAAEGGGEKEKEAPEKTPEPKP